MKSPSVKQIVHFFETNAVCSPENATKSKAKPEPHSENFWPKKFATTTTTPTKSKKKQLKSKVKKSKPCPPPPEFKFMKISQHFSRIKKSEQGPRIDTTFTFPDKLIPKEDDKRPGPS